LSYKFIASAIEGSENLIERKFYRYFLKNPKCELIFRTADNRRGGLFTIGDVYVYPTVREGVGLTITEAMATGMPVITTDYPTMNEWLTDNVEGRLIKVKKIKKGSMMIDNAYVDTKHLADLLIDYIEHPKKIEDHSNNARKKIEKFYNWDDRDGEILKILE
jgi:glycosyltransferase involved in cell wall biosynthesis